MHLPPEIIDNELKTEAQKAGANVIQIESQQGNKFTRLCVPAKMYLLKEPFITNYKKAKDSIANYRNKNLCSLHIRSFETYSKVEVYFNDSLIGSLPRSWSKSKNKPKLNFTSTHEGVLWLKVEGRKHKMEALNIPYHQIRAEFKISMGNEYFINIDIAKGHNIFSEVKNISETGWYYW
jgi:hypothetical protein